MNADEHGSVGYTLEELLTLCDATVPLTQEEREWLEDGPVGRELI